MFWFAKVHTVDEEHYNCVVNAVSEAQAEFKARRYYQEDGEAVAFVEAEMFNSFEHGDPEDYEIVT